MGKPSIGDLAESILNENFEQYKKEADLPAGESADPDIPDISNVKVPEEFIQAIVEGKETFSVSRPPVEKQPKPKKEVVLEEEVEEFDIDEFITEFKSLLNKGIFILNELCSSGMIGVGPGKATKKKKKRYVLRKNKKPAFRATNREG